MDVQRALDRCELERDWVIWNRPNGVIARRRRRRSNPGAVARCWSLDCFASLAMTTYSPRWRAERDQLSNPTRLRAKESASKGRRSSALSPMPM
jgi:hypothetical protein